MSSQFDTIINRKNTNSLKYDFAVERDPVADFFGFSLTSVYSLAIIRKLK